MAAYERESWFHNGISAHDAIDILNQKPNGSFLFRPSSSAGYLSLSYKGVNGDDVIHHIRVQHSGGKFVTDGDPVRYDTLRLLVSARNSILLTPVHCRVVTPESNYAPVPTRAPAAGNGMGASSTTSAAAPPNEVDVSSLMDMGFTRPEALRALKISKGSVEEALELLMNGGATEEAAAAADAAAATTSGGAGKGGGKGGKGRNGESGDSMGGGGNVFPNLGVPVPNLTPKVLSNGSSRMTTGIGGNSLHGAVGVTEDQNKKSKNYMEDGFVLVPDLAADMAYYAVYDGHSGRETVEYVQQKLHNNLSAAITSGMTVPDAYTYAYQKTDQELYDLGIRTAGSTSVSALIRREGNQRVLHVANAGDARCVLSKGGKAIRMSFDHKVEVESETKRILALGGTILWGRVQGQTMVSRALGDHDLKKYVIPDPHYRREVLDRSCDFIIVACDGIWDVASDQEAVDAIKGGKDPKAMSAKLIQFVLDKGTKDNLTAMIIMLK